MTIISSSIFFVDYLKNEVENLYCAAAYRQASKKVISQENNFSQSQDDSSSGANMIVIINFLKDF